MKKSRFLALMAMATIPIAVTIAATLVPGTAWAQGAYRCGDSYSQQPCAGGVPVQTDDARSPQQKAQADAATRRDAKAADAMQKARLKQEAQPAALSILPARTTSTPDSPPAPVEPKPVAKKKKHKKEPEYFTAVAPRKPGDKLPARKKKAGVKAG